MKTITQLAHRTLSQQQQHNGYPGVMTKLKQIGGHQLVSFGKISQCLHSKSKPASTISKDHQKNVMLLIGQKHSLDSTKLPDYFSIFSFARKKSTVVDIFKDLGYVLEWISKRAPSNKLTKNALIFLNHKSNCNIFTLTKHECQLQIQKLCSGKRTQTSRITANTYANG